jgi:hypothetical protein
MNPKRLETLYRMVYESFTPGMMRRTPLWLKRRIARALEYDLVRELSADAFMRALFTAKTGELAPMSVAMFDSSAGGYSVRPFFRPIRYWRAAQRIWRGQTHTGKQLAALGQAKNTARVEFPGFPPPNEIAQRRRLR